MFGCSDTVAAYVAPDASATFAGFDYNAELGNFVGEDKNKDRTAFSDEGKVVGEYLFTRLNGISGLATEKQEYSISLKNAGDTVALNAVNVISTYNKGKDKRVAFFAHYDNMYGNIEALGASGNGSSGIADNATGVVALISLAEAFAANAPSLDFTVDFVFTGSDEYGFSGTSKYLTDWIPSVADVLLAVNLETIVGSNINVYSDVVPTVQQKIFVGSGEVYDTVFTSLSKRSPLLPINLTGASEFSDYGQLSGAAEFIGRNVPVVSLFGWRVNGFGYYEPEKDDYAAFVTNHTEFASAAKDVASLVYGAVTDERFVAAADKFTSGEGYGFFNGGYFAYLAYLGLIIVLCVVLILVVKKLAKKFGNAAANPTSPAKVKVAVFGPEYEDEESGDVIVDFREPENPDPFDGNDD